MKKKGNWLWIGTIAAVLILCVWYFLIRGNSREIEYKFDEVRKGDIAIVVTATGALQAVTTVQVGSQVSGIVAKLYADFNTVVRAGEIVAQLDTTFLYASVKESEASLERAVAQSQDSKRTFDRTSELFKKGLVSQAEFDAARTALETQSAAVKQSRATLDRARVNLKYATIRAPIDGVVISRNVDVGQTVAASFSAPTLFVIANDLTKMQVQASVDEADIGRISIGQEVSFTVDAYPDDRFSGRVAEIRLQPNNVQNVINYTVIIDVPNDDLRLMPGMTANVTVQVDRQKGVLKVPNLALRFTPPDAEENGAEKPREQGNGPQGGERASSEARGGTSGGYDHAGGGMPERSPGGGAPARREKGEYKSFSRPDIMTARDVSDDRTPARNLTVKWKRTVETYRRKESAGQVYIMDNNRKLKAVPLRLGISDGVFTEILSGDLRAGDRILIGSVVKNGEEQQQQTNPFVPRRPGGRR